MATLLRFTSLKRLLPTLESYRQGITGIGIQFRSFASKGKRRTKSDRSESRDDKLLKKDLALHQALDKITASFGKGTVMWLGRSVAPKQSPVISSGSLALDLAMGTGGYPKGRIIEIYGPEASGKTTLALHVIAEAQKYGGSCAFVDAERALDPALAKVIGVNSESLLLSQPDNVEQALSHVDTLIQSSSVDVIVVDNVAALVPKNELEGEMGVAAIALHGKLMSQALRKLTHSLSLSKAILIFVNQINSKLSTIGGYGGPTEVTSGGNALKFYASMRLYVQKTGSIKKGEEISGSQVLVKIVKNKLAPPFKTAQFEIELGKGISRDLEVTELGLIHNLIAKGDGPMYSLNGQSFPGKDAIRRHLTENPEALEELMTKLREKLMHVVDDENRLESKAELENDVLGTFV